MSDNTKEQKVAEKPETATKETSSKKTLFKHLNSDLSKALTSWDTLTEEVAHKISPDEEQLLEVKRLLGELKSKINEFSE